MQNLKHMEMPTHPAKGFFAVTLRGRVNCISISPGWVASPHTSAKLSFWDVAEAVAFDKGTKLCGVNTSYTAAEKKTKIRRSRFADGRNATQLKGNVCRYGTACLLLRMASLSKQLW